VNTAELMTAILAPDIVLLAAVVAAWHLLKRGGGLQLKTAPAPRQPARKKAPKPDAEALAPVEEIAPRRDAA
jgi:hypothetical protein